MWTCSKFKTNWRKYFWFFSIKLIFFFLVSISHLHCPSVGAMKIWSTMKKKWLWPTNSWELLHKVCIEIWPWGCEERLQSQHTQVSSPPHLIVTLGLQACLLGWESGWMIRTKGQQVYTIPPTSQDAPEPGSCEMLPFSAISSHHVDQAFHSDKGNLW